MEQTRSCEHAFFEGGGLIPPPGRLRKVLVVGAGVAGLQTARQLLRLGAQVLVLETNDEVGGVWIRNYIGFGLQVPWRMYEFPEFPWPKDIKPNSEYPTGQEVHEYVQAYCRKFDLRRCIRFNCKLLRLRWCPGTRQWDALYCDTLQEKFFKVTVDYTVICAGIYSQPYIPDYEGTDSYAGIQLHAKDFVDLSLARGRRVVIVGAGKTALDCVSSIVATNTATSVTLLYRQAHWPLPRRIMGTSVRRLLFNRAMTGMMPPYYTAGRAAAMGDKLTSPLKKLFWRSMESIISRKFRITEQMRPRVHLPADLFYGGQILDNTMDKLVRGEALVTIKGEINRFVRNGVILQDGNFVAADLVLYCTGYLKTYEYLEGDMRARLDLQKDGLYLYRNCLPYAVPHLAFIGSEVSTYNNILTHGLQALWLAHVLSGRLQVPAPTDMVEDVRAQQRWRRSIMPAQRSRGSVLMLYMMQYHDQLLTDIGHPPRRKGLNLLAECLGAYTAFDYRDIIVNDETALAAKEAEEHLAAVTGAAPAVLATTASSRTGHMAASAALTNTHHHQQLPGGGGGAAAAATPGVHGRVITANDAVMYGHVAVAGAMMAPAGGAAAAGFGSRPTSRKNGLMGSTPAADRRLGPSPMVSGRGVGSVGAFCSLRGPHGEAEHDNGGGLVLQGGTGVVHSPRSVVVAANMNGGGGEVANGGGGIGGGLGGAGSAARPASRTSSRTSVYAGGQGFGPSYRTLEDVEADPAGPSPVCASASARRKLHRNHSGAAVSSSTGIDPNLGWVVGSEQHPARSPKSHMRYSLDAATAAAAAAGPGMVRYGRRHNSSRAALGGGRDVIGSSSSSGVAVAVAVSATSAATAAATATAIHSGGGGTPISSRAGPAKCRPPSLDIPGAAAAPTVRPPLSRKSSPHAEPSLLAPAVPGRSSSQVWRGSGQGAQPASTATAAAGCSQATLAASNGGGGGGGSGTVPHNVTERRGPTAVCRSFTARGVREGSASGSFAGPPSSPSRLSRHTGPSSPLPQRSQQHHQQHPQQHHQQHQPHQQHSPRLQLHTAAQPLPTQPPHTGAQGPQSQSQSLGTVRDEEQQSSGKFAFVSADHAVRGASGDDNTAWAAGKLATYWQPDSRSGPSMTGGRCLAEGGAGGGRHGGSSAGADGGAGAGWGGGGGGCSCCRGEEGSTSEEGGAWCAQPNVAAVAAGGGVPARGMCHYLSSGPHVNIMLDSAGEEVPSSCRREGDGVCVDRAASGAETLTSGEGACNYNSTLKILHKHEYPRIASPPPGTPAGAAALTDHDGSQASQPTDSEEEIIMGSRCGEPGSGQGGLGASGGAHRGGWPNGRGAVGGRPCANGGGGGSSDRCPQIAASCTLSHSSDIVQLSTSMGTEPVEGPGRMSVVDSSGSRMGSVGLVNGKRLMAGDSAYWLSATSPPWRKPLPLPQTPQHHEEQPQKQLRGEALGTAGSHLAAAPSPFSTAADDVVLAPPSLSSPQPIQHPEQQHTHHNHNHHDHHHHHQQQQLHQHPLHHSQTHPQYRPHSAPPDALLHATAVSPEPRVANMLTSLAGAVPDHIGLGSSPNSNMSLSHWQVTLRDPGTRRSSVALGPLAEEDDGGRSMLVGEPISLTGMTGADGDSDLGGAGTEVREEETVADWSPLRPPLGRQSVSAAVPVPAQHGQPRKLRGVGVEDVRAAVGDGVAGCGCGDTESGGAVGRAAVNRGAKRGAGGGVSDGDGACGGGGEDRPGSQGLVGRSAGDMAEEASLEGMRGDGGGSGSDVEVDEDSASAAPLRRGSDALGFSWTASGGVTSSSLTSSTALRDWRRVATGVQTSADVGWSQNLGGGGGAPGGAAAAGGSGGDGGNNLRLGSGGPSVSNCSTGSSSAHMHSYISLANGLDTASSAHSSARAPAPPARVLGLPQRQHSMSRLSRSATNDGAPAGLEIWPVVAPGEGNPPDGMVVGGAGHVELAMVASSPKRGGCNGVATGRGVAERMPQNTAGARMDASPFRSPNAYAFALGSQAL